MSVVIGTVFFTGLLVSPCNKDCNVAVDGFMFLVIGTMLYNQLMVVPYLPWCNPPSQVEMQAVISPPSDHNNSPRSSAQSSPQAVAAGKKRITIQDAEESYQSCTDEQSSLLASPSPGRHGGKYI